jgi:hypothetical protein
MADLGGLGDKAKDFANSEKATDSGIDKAEDAASNATGGKFDDKVEGAGDAADKKVGT